MTGPTPTPRAPRLPRAAGGIVLAALLLAHGALWLLAPSRQVSSDGLDELAAVEHDELTLNRKHPAAEPAVWMLVRVLRAAGHEGPGLRPVQCWSGAWMTLALGALGLGALRRGGALQAAAMVVIAGGGFASVHLALDPVLFFVPPGLALLSLSALWIAVARRTRRGPAWIASAALHTAMVLVNPMTAAAVVPLTLAWHRHWRDPHASTWPGLVPAALLGALPLAAVGAAVTLIEGLPLSAGPYGTWAGPLAALSREGIEGALWATPRGIGPLAALGGATSTAGLTATAGALLLPTAAAAALVHALRAGRHTLLRGLPWLAAAAATAAFLVWWNPNQFLFWVHPLWMLLLGWGAIARRPAPLSDALALLAGVALIVSSISAYALPATRQESPARARAEAIAAHFEPGDVLLFPLYPDPAIEYYGGVRTSGMMAISMARPPELDTFAYLALAMDLVHDAGGRVFLLEPGVGETWIRGNERDRATLDYGERDFDRFEWGEVVVVGDEAFREARALGPPQREGP